MTSSQTPDLAFGLSARQKFDELIDMHRQFASEPLNDKLARNCAEHVWHLIDAFVHEFSAQIGFNDLTSLRAHVRSSFPEIDYFHDICNSSKHLKLTRQKSTMKRAHLRRGSFSQEFSRDFDIDRLEIELIDGRRIDFLDVLDRAVGYWSSFKKEHQLFEDKPDGSNNKELL